MAQYNQIGLAVNNTLYHATQSTDSDPGIDHQRTFFADDDKDGGTIKFIDLIDAVRRNAPGKHMSVSGRIDIQEQRI